MKDKLKRMFGLAAETMQPLKFEPLNFLPRLDTIEQGFRQRTVDDIASLERAQRKDMARLEAVKLIDHLKKEFEI